MQGGVNPSIPLGPLQNYTQATKICTVLDELDVIMAVVKDFHHWRIMREWVQLQARQLSEEEEDEVVLAVDNSEVQDSEGNNAE